MRQAAVKPPALTLRSIGRKAPEKLGCGQSEVMASDVSRATGAKSSDEEPPSTSSRRKANGFSGASADARICVARSGELDVDAVLLRGRHADAGRKRELALPVERQGGGLLQARDVADAERKHRIAPAHVLEVGGDVRHVGRQEASFDRNLRRVNDHLEDRAVQDLGLRVRLDVELLGQEDRAALLGLLHALVALHRLEAHRVGDHQEGTGDLLGCAPGPCHVALHLARPALALVHQPEHQGQGDEQEQNQKRDQEELERRAAPEALRGGKRLVHHPFPGSAIRWGKMWRGRRQMWGGSATNSGDLPQFAGISLTRRPPLRAGISALWRPRGPDSSSAASR